MTTPRRRRSGRSGPAEEIFRLSQQYLHLREIKLAAEKSFTAAARPLRAWLNELDDDGRFANGETDADGNRILRFDHAIPGAGDKMYDGVMLRRTQGLPLFDEEEVLAFAAEKRLSDRLVKTIQVPDLEQLYVLQQEGTISEADLRGLMHTPAPTYALWPVEAAELSEEDE